MHFTNLYRMHVYMCICICICLVHTDYINLQCIHILHYCILILSGEGCSDTTYNLYGVVNHLGILPVVHVSSRWIIYIFVWMHVYLYIYECIYAYMFFMNVCIYECMYLCMYLYTVRMSIYVYLCMYVCM